MNISDLFAIKTIQVKPDPAKGTDSTVRTGVASLRLSPGQLVQGRVVQNSSQGGLLLDIEGQTVTVESRIALQPGETIWLEVRQGGDKPWFVLAEKKAATLEAMRALLADSPSLAKAFRAISLLADPKSSSLPSSLAPQLQAFFQTISTMVIDGRPSPEAIMRLTAWLAGGGAEKRHSGSLRPVGVELSEVIKAAGDIDTRILASGMDQDKLERLAGFLKNIGQVNETPVPSNQQNFLLFPCFFSGNAGWGEWLFSLDREEKEASRPPAYSLEFFLAMSQLGDVHIRLQLQDRSIGGEVGVESEEIFSFLEKELPILVHAIEGLDFRPVHIQIRQSNNSHLQNLKEALESKADLHSSALFHVTA